jgi:hypothetical protein
MSIPDIIPVEVSGYCDLETGECVTVGPSASDEPASDPALHPDRVLVAEHGGELSPADRQKN